MTGDKKRENGKDIERAMETRDKKEQKGREINKIEK